MTVPLTARRNGPYVTNGATINFAYTFSIEADDELKVYKLNTTTLVEELLTLDVDYTVTGAGGSSGNVVIDPALAAGFEITIVGITDQSQLTDYPTQGTYHADVIEASLDKLTKIVIEQQEQLDRCLKINVTDTPDGTEEFDPDAGSDAFVKRLASGSFALAVATAGLLIGDVSYGTTASRPAGLGAADAMQYVYLDTTLGYPVYWDGSTWKNFAGTEV